eukprot:CAMPEP_0170293266 /NCGR_PEP_ID=MMETSP0116_2-20130129/46737_1 /TAXON_ID=400756 /ORGANISM="Durinskia baltica, Strain CSIRO CS-38" /LENGTH=154 /DNA_ID=CAMNT_0010544777 /DNA_START=101 /DNA_END=562 /DNA_ORIENTATION=-
MLNIVNGFFVESAMQAAKADRQHKVAEVARNKQKYIDELRRVFRLIDQDGSNQITFKEFKRCVEHQEFQDYLAAFDLDIEAGEEIFHLLDANSDGTVTFEEFVQGCMRFRGQATAMDIASVRQVAGGEGIQAHDPGIDLRGHGRRGDTGLGALR